MPRGVALTTDSANGVAGCYRVFRHGDDGSFSLLLGAKGGLGEQSDSLIAISASTIEGLRLLHFRE